MRNTANDLTRCLFDPNDKRQATRSETSMSLPLFPRERIILNSIFWAAAAQTRSTVQDIPKPNYSAKRVIASLPHCCIAAYLQSPVFQSANPELDCTIPKVPRSRNIFSARYNPSIILHSHAMNSNAPAGKTEQLHPLTYSKPDRSSIIAFS